MLQPRYVKAFTCSGVVSGILWLLIDFILTKTRCRFLGFIISLYIFTNVEHEF